MAGSKITMLTRIDDNGVNAISLDGEEGIWVGSSKSITLSSTSNTSNANVELNPNHILFGVTNLNSNSNSVTEITKDYIIFGVGNAIDDLSDDNTDIELNGSLTGAKLTKDKISLSVGANNNRSVFIADLNGITIGSGTTPIVNSATKSGSYVNISGKGVEIGSLGNLYLNTNNVKLQTDITYGTRFALGQNLQSTDSVNGVSSSTDVGLVYNTHGLFIRGNIYADNGYFNGIVEATTFVAPGQNGQFIADATHFGFYTLDNTPANILTVSTDTLDIASSYTLNIGGDLNINADNFGINSNAGTNEAMFRLGSGNNTALEYKNGTLSVTGNITASSFTIAGITPFDSQGHIDAGIVDNIPEGLTTDNLNKVTVTSTGLDWGDTLDTGEAGLIVGSQGSMQIAANGNLTIANNGNFAIQSGGIFSIDSSNVILDTNAGNGETIFQLKNGSTNYFDISKDGNGVISATLGGWSILGNKLYSGSDTSYVALDANTSDTYAIWCGDPDVEDALFRVKRNGSVYLNSLMVLDERTRESTDAEWGEWAVDNNGTHEDLNTSEDQLTQTGYVAVDFSKLNFKQAISLSLKWSGENTVTATASFWGRFNTTASSSLSISIGAITVGTVISGGVYNASGRLQIRDNGGTYSVTEPLATSVDVTNIISTANQNGFNRCLTECDLSAGETFYTDGTYYSSLYIMGQSGPQPVGSGRVGLTSHTAPSWGE